MQRVKGRLATCKRSLGQRLQHGIPPTAPVIAWLVSHAIFVRAVRKKPEGTGLSAYHQVTGREFSTRLLEFGDSCRFRLFEREAASGYRVRQGVFLGHDRVSGRYTVHAGGKVHVVRTVTRLPNGMKWNLQGVQDVRCLPRDGHTSKTDGVVSNEKIDGAQEELRGRDPLRQGQRAPIYRAYLVQFGFTDPGCGKRARMLRYPGEQSSGAHSGVCRRRIYARLAETSEGRERPRRADVRQGRALEEHAELQGDAVVQGGERRW